MKNVLIINGHPSKKSFCSSLAHSYAKGTHDSKAEVKLVELGDLDFDPILHEGYSKIQELEPDLVKLQEDIKWAHHIVIVYPTWWNSMPAIMKGLFDRMWLPRFAFKFTSPYWHKKLLKGRSARLIITMDSPWLIYRFIFGGCGEKIMKRSILKFAGISPVKVTHIDFMKISTEKRRHEWLDYVKKLGRKLI